MDKKSRFLGRRERVRTWTIGLGRGHEDGESCVKRTIKAASGNPSRREPATEIVLLVDELDSHLHPQWQRTILPAGEATRSLDDLTREPQYDPVG